MNIGMLWYDDSPLALKERIEKAAAYYAEKHGRKPNLCLVHPSMLNGDELRVNGVLVRRFSSVRPGHFWIGVDDEPQEPRRPASAAGTRRVAKQAKPKPRAAAPAARKPRSPSRAKATRKRAGRA